MRIKQGVFAVSEDTLRLCVATLKYYAYMEAGQTQKPDLCTPEDYEEWGVAAKLERRLGKLDARRNAAKANAAPYAALHGEASIGGLN
jgi:hypothetical protein